MKRLTLTLALILTSLMSFSQTKDSDGHTLVSLWKTYYKAEKADKPKKGFLGLFGKGDKSSSDGQPEGQAETDDAKKAE